MAHHLFAGVAELADALDLGSSVLRRGGSSPFTRTNSNNDSRNDSQNDSRLWRNGRRASFEGLVGETPWRFESSQPHQSYNAPVAQLDRASDYGSEG